MCPCQIAKYSKGKSRCRINVKKTRGFLSIFCFKIFLFLVILMHNLLYNLVCLNALFTINHKTRVYSKIRTIVPKNVLFLENFDWIPFWIDNFSNLEISIHHAGSFPRYYTTFIINAIISTLFNDKI